MSFILNLLGAKDKPLHSLIEENNILGKYDEYNLVTKDENLVSMFLIDGISYSSLSDTQVLQMVDIRNDFFKSIPSEISVSVFQKREKIVLTNRTKNLKNKYAKEIIEVWENEVKGYQTKYYISFASRKKNINILEKRKSKITSSKTVTKNIEFIKNMIDELALTFTNLMDNYNVKRLSADEALSFYASYCNMQDTKITNAKNGILQDSYIDSNLEFKKDYFIHDNSINKKYSRFISVKAYDTDEIKADVIKEILAEPIQLLICEQINNIKKDKAIKKIDKKIAIAQEISRAELEEQRQLVLTDRQTILYSSFSILVTSNNLDDLDFDCNRVKTILQLYGLISTIENINMKTLYFSFFPGRDNLNARKRIQTSENISVLNLFEKDVTGFLKNSFGDEPVTIFKTLNEIPYFFNFHNAEKKQALGHVLVIGESDSGKTTLISFLKTCLLKYDINILGLDKLNGMHNITTFLDCEYADVNDEFSLNPFSLEYTEENKNFLIRFLEDMAEIKEDEFEESIEIANAIDNLYKHGGEHITFSDFLDTLVRIENLEERFLKYKHSIFDNEKCVINFSKQMSVLKMDTLLKNTKTSSLTAFYLFHKIRKISEKEGKPFFIFIDELKDYLHNKQMAHNILENMLEARKVDGVVALGVQNLDFFDLIDNKDSFIDNFAYYIIFPTKSKKSLSRMRDELGLNETEINFLETTNPKLNHHILLKNQKTRESIFLDVDLSKLGKYLKVFDSGTTQVAKMKELIKNNPDNWREEYLK
jgi:type IV secretion system protein VirB4/ComB4 competence protein